MSTEGGLFRFDGDRFRSFRAERATKKGDINCLYNSADGQLWAGSAAGLFRWNGENFTAVAGLEEVTLDNQQSIWGDATSLYLATTLGVRAVPLKGGRAISPRPSSAALAASDGTLWFSCGDLLCSIHNGRERE